MEKKENYNYLLRLYSQVDDYLSSATSERDSLPEIVVAFCIATEKVFKMRLYQENPILVYENSKYKEVDSLVTIIKQKEINIETIKIKETLIRYKLMFENEFSDEEIQVLVDLYNIRNHFLHDYKADDAILSDQENIVTKMGTVWEKISTQAVSLFGKDSIKANKPKKKYSEKELEDVLIQEVKTKIQSKSGLYEFSPFSDSNLISNPSYLYSSVYSVAAEDCPRCGASDFSLDAQDSNIFAATNINVFGLSKTFTDLYKCKKCNLELTKKEYEIAKKIKVDAK